ncbi:50S ribosomal protein L9 [Algimonas porphyrae]|uniref:Large ribosomal subunit protein bL9 n=1 Tax=Algimonas porphyrae TaxID=1128113 RepID=A0ABQ5UXH0_9PROT|nr:50S ribosomal protein L9 [Algimonas porphyrae]GLQ19906.1 50S ribosomal protein L9 [Algimonas porphyrae]
MEVILLERVEKLGNMGDVVSVKPGFARNFLIPQDKALRATKANKVRFEAEREYLEQRNAENRERAGIEGKSIDGTQIVMIRRAGDTGQLYGSVSVRDIYESLMLKDISVKRNQIIVEQPIKTLGVHEVQVRLHAEVSVPITVNVARSEDEAERQAKGEDVIATQMAEERADANEAAQERAEVVAEMFEGDAPEAVSEETVVEGDASEMQATEAELSRAAHPEPIEKPAEDTAEGGIATGEDASDED